MTHRFQGYDHPALYKMINSGPGPAASAPQTEYWAGLSTQLSQIDTDLNNKLQTLKATWQGAAGDSAQGGMTPLQQWAGDAQSGTDTMRASSELQGTYIGQARASMPEPVEVTTPAPSAWQVAGAAIGGPIPALIVAGQAADHEAQERAKAEAEQKAVDTMNNYQSSTEWNTSTLGTFVPPPDVVVAAPVPAGAIGGGTVGDSGVAAAGIPNGGGTSAQGFAPAGVPGGGPGGPGAPFPGGPGGQPGGPTVPSGGQGPFPGPGGGGQFPQGPGGTGPGGSGPFAPGTGPFRPGSDVTRGGGSGKFGNPGFGPGGRGPGIGGPGGQGGPGGPGAGRGGVGGFGTSPVDAEGRGGRGGIGGAGGAGALGENVPGRGGAPGAGGFGPGGAGGRGGAAGGPMGAGGRGAKGEGDDEHETPDYLMETEDVFGDERMVAPPVIGESRGE